MNTIVAEAFDEIASVLEPVAGTDQFIGKLQETLRNVISAHKKVVFNGDNYSDEWREEAAKRGLPNIISVPEALKTIVNPATILYLRNMKYLILQNCIQDTKYIKKNTKNF